METYASFQLFSVGKSLENNISATFDAIAATGLKKVEVFDFVNRASELSRQLHNSGLQAPSGHAMFLTDQKITASGEKVSAVEPAQILEAASELGIKFLVDPFVPLQRWESLNEISRTAERLNSFAELAGSYGIIAGYHNHTQEFFRSFGNETAFEIFVRQLDQRVKLEIDLFWASIAGLNPAELVAQYSDRVFALHIKDGVMIPDPFVGKNNLSGPVFGQVAAGQGEILLLDSLKAAQKAELAVIEFDHFEGDIYNAVAESLDFLRLQGVQL